MTLTQSKPAKIGGMCLIGFAGVLVVVEVVLHVLATVEGHKYSINYVMLAIALVIGFTGMYILSPPRAKDGGQFLVDNALKVIQVMKAGRRNNDPTAAIVENAQGQRATVVIPHPEAEVPLKPTIDPSGPARRKTDGLPEIADSLEPPEGEKGA
jgi:hypothetical protein